MAHRAPGKHYREGMTLLDITRMFPDNETTEEWFIENRWSEGIVCPKCGSDNVAHVRTRKPQPYRCRSCRKHFSVKTGTIMEGSNLGFQVWAIAIYLLTTGIKGQSSMKLHRDLGVTQKTAWFLAHRIRETWNDNKEAFDGPVEVDETFIGGKRQNMRWDKRKEMKGRGGHGKAIVAGVKDRGTNEVTARVVPEVHRKSLMGFVRDNVKPGATVYTDQAAAYQGMSGFTHESVNHSAGEYVREQAHTNGIESFWALLKRGYQGTYHKMSKKHLERYVNEFAGRHNGRDNDTKDQMSAIARGMSGRRLRYEELTA